jgi:hypothetical protein
MIKYKNFILYGIKKKELPVKGSVALIGEKKGMQKFYYFYPSSEGQWLFIRKGFVKIVEKGAIVSYAYCYYNKHKLDITIFFMAENGIFEHNGHCYNVVNGKLKKCVFLNT